MGEALNKFVEETQGIAAHFDPTTVFSIGGWNVTQYIVWLFIAFVVVMAVVLIAGKSFRWFRPASFLLLSNIFTSSFAATSLKTSSAKALKSTFRFLLRSSSSS